MNGILVVNKPEGCTSHDIVYKVKKIVNEKVGHTGTLDPLAEGVLPILIGKATLASKYLINHDKKYIVLLKLGEKTDTADREGKIVEKMDVDKSLLTELNIKKIFEDFIGKQKQIPPIYSAIKVNGKKLYEYARKGQDVEIEPREIEIYALNLLNYNVECKTVEFEVKCSKGTYIRSLCEDIAKKFNTVGYMEKLKRIEVGDFKIEDSISFDEIKEEPSKIEEKLITLEQLFKNNPAIELTENQIKHLLNGVKITQNSADGIYKIYNKKKEFLGIAELKNKLLKRDIIC